MKFAKNTEISDATLHNIFDVVSSDDAIGGSVNFRCIYMKNTNVSLTFAEVISYITSNTPSVDTVLGIGPGTAAVGGVEQLIPDEDTAPIGVAFVEGEGIGNKVDLGSIPPTSYKAIWLRRLVSAGAQAVASDLSTIRVEGSTVA